MATENREPKSNGSRVILALASTLHKVASEPSDLAPTLPLRFQILREDNLIAGSSLEEEG